LHGDEIRIEARIIAVADSYDAMITDRPYKKGMQPSAALQELKKCIGTFYDQEIVHAFEKYLVEHETEL
jgi:HD-GYP domain-containing protein (c-di-GMP phosphodiesterase class II)